MKDRVGAISRVNLGRKLQNVEAVLMSIGVGGTWTSVKTMITARIQAVGEAS